MVKTDPNEQERRWQRIEEYKNVVVEYEKARVLHEKRKEAVEEAKREESSQSCAVSNWRSKLLAMQKELGLTMLTMPVHEGGVLPLPSIAHPAPKKPEEPKG